jgi:hypothetical protein
MRIEFFVPRQARPAGSKGRRLKGNHEIQKEEA